jgi:hypothetical protein
VWRILHIQPLYPYHLQRAQGLSATDFPPRVNFCQWMQHSVLNLPFLSNILSTDEAGFTRDGMFNYHNCHIWCDENPQAVHESRHQQRFSLNVWVGVPGDCLIGPHILPNKLTGKRYRRFLQNILPGLLEQSQNTWFRHDVHRHILLEL